MTHPLTDEICGDIAENLPDYNAETCMRAAADWQLEQCVEELECLLSVFAITGVVEEEAVSTMVELFKSHVRPQEDS